MKSSRKEATYKAMKIDYNLFYVKQLKRALETVPDDTIVALGIVPISDKGKNDFEPRAFRLMNIGEGTLANGRKFVALISGQDITGKVPLTGAYLMEDKTNDNITGNKKDSDE